MIFNARDLSLMTHLTAPDLMLVGSHSEFFPPHVGNYRPHDDVTTPRPGDVTTDSATSIHTAVSSCLLLILIDRTLRIMFM